MPSAQEIPTLLLEMTQVSGFTLVRNATLLDFPLEASIASVLPGVDEMVVNVGVSEDDTLQRVRGIGSPKLRVIESEWNPGLGPAMLAEETDRARLACRGQWGIYVQADEVLADGGAVRLREMALARNDDPRVEGLLVDYLHFYGGFRHVARNRKWYRRECRVIRLDPSLGIHSFRDAQGFRVGENDRRIRAVLSGVKMHHYGWARPAWALVTKRSTDRGIYPWREHQDQERPLLPWIPGIRSFDDEHPAVLQPWLAERISDERLISPWYFDRRHPRLILSELVERLTGWRPLEYRNYTLVP